MSLAEELLADLEEGGEESEYLEEPEALEKMETDSAENSSLIDTSKLISITQICTLNSSQQLRKVMTQIESNFYNVRSTNELSGPVEADSEYLLIVEANTLAVEIDNEINTIHKFIRDKYNKRFPELESLVVSPLEYVETVRELGNDLTKAKNNEILASFLTQATIMVVSVTASTTQGQMLSEDELAQVIEACNTALDLNAKKLKIFSYVELRMAFIAPNVSAIIGSATAAKLMGIAGGLTRLSKMPACNIQVLGSQKRILGGFSQVSALPHTGYLYYSSFVQDTAPDLRRKAARLLAAKVALASRVDANHESRNGDIGKSLKEEIEKKLDKLQEPPPVKLVKPLPKPVDPPKKRRGGKRVRKLKERYAVTELRKQANRITFGDIGEDAYQDDLGYNRGTVGKSGTGKVRMAQIDEKTKVRISKTLQKNLQKQQVYGGSTTIKKQISGTASSVAFTPLQGLEIVTATVEKKVNEANAKYFSNTGSFININKKQ